LEQILAKTSKVIVNAGEGNNLIYLPLDRLMVEKQQATDASPVEQSSSNTMNNPLKEPLSITSGFQKEKNP
jgi:hypothetical protein